MKAGMRGFMHNTELKSQINLPAGQSARQWSHREAAISKMWPHVSAHPLELATRKPGACRVL